MENHVFKSSEELDRERQIEELGFGEHKEEIKDLEKQIKSRSAGTFRVCDLYIWEWRNKSDGEKSSLGMRFKKYVNKGVFPDVSIFDDTKNGPKVYIKNYVVNSMFRR